MVHSEEMPRRGHWKDAAEWLDAGMRDEKSGCSRGSGFTMIEILQNIPVVTPSPLIEFSTKSCSEGYIDGFLEPESCSHDWDQHLSDVTSCSGGRPHTHPPATAVGPAAVTDPRKAVSEGRTAVAWGTLSQVGTISFFLL